MRCLLPCKTNKSNLLGWIKRTNLRFWDRSLLSCDDPLTLHGARNLYSPNYRAKRRGERMFFKRIFRARRRGKTRKGSIRVRSQSKHIRDTTSQYRRHLPPMGKLRAYGRLQRKFERLADRRRWKKSCRVDIYPGN